MGSDIAWVIGLIYNRNLPQDLLWQYLRTYCEAVARQLGGTARPLLDWFGRTLAEQ
jgi:hypothetical protein